MNCRLARPLLFILTLAIITGSSGNVSAWVSTPALNPANGHYYAFFTATPGTKYLPPRIMTFEDASALAIGMSHLGIPGHLATITSQAEQDFIFQQFLPLVGNPTGYAQPFESFMRFWIGASDAVVEGEWRWTAGPEAGQLFWLGDEKGAALGYENWSSYMGTHYEPNDDGFFLGSRDEDYATMILESNPKYPSSYWNDVPSIKYRDSFIPVHGVVEFSPLPEPSTTVLITSSSLVILAARRRRFR